MTDGDGMSDGKLLRYPCPWTPGEQPRVRVVDRNWYRRPTDVRNIGDWWIRVPEHVRRKIPNCPRWILIPDGFICDGRSSPVGLIFPWDHPGAWPHDARYRWPQWGDYIMARGGADLGVMTRRDSDWLFSEHLKAVGQRQPVLHWDPRRMRPVQALGRPLQLAAVRVGGRGAFEREGG